MRIRIIDAFTDRPFSGNPAGVCLLDGDTWPDDARMRQVAAELNLSETAFARPLPPGGDADWGLRWFTPAVEVDLCGHATLATAHALRSDGLLRESGEAAGGGVRFATRSGVLTARAAPDGGLTLDFPASPVVPVPVPAGTAEALGAAVTAAYDTGPLGDLLVEVADERTVRALEPDLAAVARLETRGVVVTAAAEDPAAAHDFVSRFFGPAVGVPEDPVTGSAHTALAPLWSARLGRSDLTGLQVSPRSGVVRTRLRGDRVLLSGHAVTVLDGVLRV
ncbi:PhzF family phenazine biosynthesis protein [Streptacidiphilus sp. ASG 303]|uniref:PhzF family phenazine biosynthesis protein n=1 Tax=Streptacidiphilus sp. ASG 303 TaxID=2896847 RepID=UPI001E63D4DC|nr:PhzF family phenazine biosynthesis protein [Streptacidiphilus sp. ASG 303]MCD0484432.1 PhzF family phenazine biosynthesis protein [Streptacidiphilus sp. ASG 303]